MKLLLIEPPVSPYDIPTGIAALPEPLSLEILAAAAPEHEVRILDMRLDGGLRREVEAFRPDAAGITAVSANLHLALAALREIKKIDPRIRTVAGGHHASLVPGDCFRPEVDAVVVGEGERTLPELLRSWERGAPPSSVRGIACRDGGGNFRFTGRRPLIDIDTMPTANRSLTARYRTRYFRGSWNPLASIIFSRGCPYRCEFCAEWKINRGTYRVRSPEAVVEELAGIEEPFVSFVDDNTFDSFRRAMELAGMIAGAGIRKRYQVYGRSDTIAAHPELVEKWAAAGLAIALVGLEAVSEERLRTWNKRIDMEINEKAIDILHANGIEIAAYFVVDPAFDRDDFRRLLDYTRRKKLTHPVFTILSPFPGTELREKRRGELLTGSYEILDFFHTVLPTRLPVGEFYRGFADLYFRSYSPARALMHLFRSKAFLSPRLLRRNREMRNRLKRLHEHHRTVIGDPVR